MGVHLLHQQRFLNPGERDLLRQKQTGGQTGTNRHQDLDQHGHRSRAGRGSILLQGFAAGLEPRHHLLHRGGRALESGFRNNRFVRSHRGYRCPDAVPHPTRARPQRINGRRFQYLQKPRSSVSEFDQPHRGVRTVLRPHWAIGHVDQQRQLRTVPQPKHPQRQHQRRLFLRRRAGRPAGPLVAFCERQKRHGQSSLRAGLVPGGGQRRHALQPRH